MLRLIRKLVQARLLSVAGGLGLLETLLTTGVNLMLLLCLAAKLHPDRPAVSSDREVLTYQRLWEQAETLALICRNHGAAIKAVFAGRGGAVAVRFLDL